MKKILFPLFLALAILACNNEDNSLNYPVDKQIVGLATTVKLKTTKTTVNLNDYFADVTLIDSISGNKKIKFELSESKDEVVINFNHESIPQLSEMKVWIKATPYSILLEKSRKIIQRIAFNPNGKNYKTVQIKADFNNWLPSAGKLELKDNVWTGAFTLNPGRYQYLIVADGKEMLDPNNPDSIDNNIGGYNSIMKVGKIGTKGLPKLATLNEKSGKIHLSVENKADQVIVFWQNYSLGEKFVANKDSVIEILIPDEASQLERSFIRVWALNKDGESNDVIIPLEKDDVLRSVSNITRNDKEASIIYFMMIDRFNNGNKSNDQPVNDKEVDPRANYFGGDIAGITEKLKDDYFTKLGINTLWLSPVTQNPYEAYKEYPKPYRKYTGYHGYWPVTLTTVDKRFGTSEELKELVKLAHEKNMNVIVDYVSHHVHQSSPLIQQHPDWKTKIDLPGGRKNIRLWDEQRLTTWFDVFLPTLDYSKKEVIETISDSVVFFAKEYDLDGFRHDATKHVPEDFWRATTRKLKKEIMQPSNKRLYQIGETFGNRELIGSYVSSGMQDAQFDFGTYFDARAAFSKDRESFEKLNSSLLETFNYYGWHHVMGNITGNHDLTRFITIAGDALKPNEDEKETPWKREIKVENPLGYQKLKSLVAFTLTIPGVPTIYYGDEIGMVGASDPDNRRPMKFTDLSDLESSVKDVVAKMSDLRKNKIALIYGDFNTLLCSDKLFAYSRSYFNESVLVIFNKDSKAKAIEIKLPKNIAVDDFKEQFGNKFTIEKNTLKIEIPAYSFEVICN